MSNVPLRTTCWSMVLGAGTGQSADRARFAAAYGPPIRDYLTSRWRGNVRWLEIEDAVQDVFVECLREGGILARVHPERTGRFRPFLFGVVRNVARRFEEQRSTSREVAGDSELTRNGDHDASGDPAVAFDRAWARAMVRQARLQLEERAAAGDELARRRCELLRLRYEEAVPVREIARRWQADPALLHHQLTDAKKEFRRALREVIAFHVPGSPDEIEAECQLLLPHLGGSPPDS